MYLQKTHEIRFVFVCMGLVFLWKIEIKLEREQHFHGFVLIFLWSFAFSFGGKCPFQHFCGSIFRPKRRIFLQGHKSYEKQIQQAKRVKPCKHQKLKLQNMKDWAPQPSNEHLWSANAESNGCSQHWVKNYQDQELLYGLTVDYDTMVKPKHNSTIG